MANGAVSVNGAAVLFVSVTACVDDDGTATMPKLTLEGDAVSTGGAMPIMNDPLPVQPLADVASTVNVDAATVVGVPDTAPVAGVNARPAGSGPVVSANVNGPGSPLAVTMPAYAVDTRPPGSVPPTVITGHVPMPINGTLRGEPPALVICSVALFEPDVAGWNDTATAVDPPGPTMVVPGAPTLKSAAFAPTMANGGVNVMLTASLLPIVSVVPELDPGGTVPKSMD